MASCSLCKPLGSPGLRKKYGLVAPLSSLRMMLEGNRTNIPFFSSSQIVNPIRWNPSRTPSLNLIAAFATLLPFFIKKGSTLISIDYLFLLFHWLQTITAARILSTLTAFKAQASRIERLTILYFLLSLNLNYVCLRCRSFECDCLELVIRSLSFKSTNQ